MTKYSRHKGKNKKIDCYCGLYPDLGNPHEVSRSTFYRHMKRAERLNPPPRAESGSGDDQQQMEIDEYDAQFMDGNFHGYQGADFPGSDGESIPNFSDDDRLSNRSWERIGTPPPSPPRSPLPGASDEEIDEDEDGFLNITDEDYREYDRWFGEEQEEIDEILADTLTEEELDSFKMLCIRLFGHISQRNYERIRYSFKDKIKLLSTYVLHKKLAKLSGINPITVDCCVNICHAFNGKYAEENTCSTCKQPRFDEKGKPRRVFEYLPTTPRFKGYFNNPDMVQQMYYRANYVQERGAMDEFFDGTLYKRLQKSPIVVEGVPQGVCYFDKVTGRRDIAYSVMLDGVTVQENAASGHSSCWPLMGQNLNLPASERAKLRNLIPLGIIPGPKQPKDFNSFLEPFVDEALEQARGVEAFDVTTG